MRNDGTMSAIVFRTRWLAAAAVGAVVTSCSVGRDGRAADAASAQALVGAWDVRLQRTDPEAVGGRAAGPVTVRGVLAFVADEHVAGVPELPDPTNAGTFEVDFEPMGFEPRDRAALPAALARAWGRDSAAILLGVDGDRPEVAMRGRWAGGGTLVGTWSLVATRMLGASGTFVMTRHGVR